MQTCIRDNKWLTSEGYRSVGATDVPTTVNEISDVWEDWEKLTAVEFDVTLAYHEGEIAEAIGDLTPRQQEFVRLRFWEGLSFPELTEYFGYEPNGLLASARKKLRERLRHLKDVT
jgi:DNA-directed RNA polymerase specialized sigma24 family protein